MYGGLYRCFMYVFGVFKKYKKILSHVLGASVHPDGFGHLFD